jgi:hypothetical protein
MEIRRVSPLSLAVRKPRIINGRRPALASRRQQFDRQRKSL